MADIRDLARESLLAAQADIAKARRTLPLAAGVLALVHLLTVHPYIETGRDIAAVSARIAANGVLLAGLDPDIATLQQTAEGAEGDLQNLLGETTEAMIGRFARLRELIGQAMAGDPPPPLPDDVLLPPAAGASLMQQMPPNMPPQMQMQQVPTMNMPVPYRPQMPLPQAGAVAGGGELAAILAAVAAGNAAAMDRLTGFARDHIVAAAYREAQAEWRARIQPPYLAALEAATAAVRGAAAKAGAVAPEAAAKLDAAADNLTRQQVAIAAIEITADSRVDAALGSDWWRTVEGKGAFADALADSVADRMRAITRTARTPADALRETQLLQQALHDGLIQKQQELEKQFSQHREQLAALSGTSGVIPVDLASFIGLFPLVIGIVLGALLLRSAQARRQAALAADGLPGTTPADAETRNWLVLRALGGTPTGSWLAGGAIALAAVSWIILAGWQIAAAPEAPPLPPWVSVLLGASLVLAATAGDLWSIRRLAARLAP